MIKLRELMNVYVANTLIFVVKLHNIHWNIVGHDFMKIHKYTEELYTRFFETYDEFAEMIKIHDQVVYASISDYLRHSTIKELGTEKLKTTEALNYILEDFEVLLKTAKEMYNFASAEDNVDVLVLVEDEIKYLNKQIWFLKSILNE